MQHLDALRKMRAFFQRDESGSAANADDVSLSGPTLLQQEPDLRKEQGRVERDVSGWAAGGHPSD